MAIIRYTASADNTITNAYTETLMSSKEGQVLIWEIDILEVFSIYGQNSSSAEGVSSEACSSNKV